MSTELRFVQVDVFTEEPLAGNPAAVVLDADDLDAGVMQAIAREMNLSETVFVLTPTVAEADYAVRIFTPRAELDFAGHPTVGTAHVLTDEGRIPATGTVWQECGAGLVAVSIQAGVASFRSPAPSFADAGVDTDALAALLRVPAGAVTAACLVDVGVRWLVVELHDPTAVSGLVPDLTGLEQHRLDVTVFALSGGAEPFVRVRSFAPAHGIPEDPVCGSGNACVAAVLSRDGRVRPGTGYVASQGEECERPGRVRVHVDSEGGIHIGGTSRIVARGVLHL